MILVTLHSKKKKQIENRSKDVGQKEEEKGHFLAIPRRKMEGLFGFQANVLS